MLARRPPRRAPVRVRHGPVMRLAVRLARALSATGSWVLSTGRGWLRRSAAAASRVVATLRRRFARRPSHVLATTAPHGGAPEGGRNKRRRVARPDADEGASAKQVRGQPSDHRASRRQEDVQGSSALDGDIYGGTDLDAPHTSSNAAPPAGILSTDAARAQDGGEGAQYHTELVFEGAPPVALAPDASVRPAATSYLPQGTAPVTAPARVPRLGAADADEAGLVEGSSSQDCDPSTEVGDLGAPPPPFSLRGGRQSHTSSTPPTGGSNGVRTGVPAAPGGSTSLANPTADQVEVFSPCAVGSTDHAVHFTQASAPLQDEEWQLVPLKKRKKRVDKFCSEFFQLPSTPGLQDKACFFCKEEGNHIAKDCPVKKNTNINQKKLTRGCERMGQGYPLNAKCQENEEKISDPDQSSYHLNMLFRQPGVDDVKLAYATFCLRRSQRLDGNKQELCHICFFKRGGHVFPVKKEKEKMIRHCLTEHKMEGFPCEQKGCCIRTDCRGDAGVHKLYLHEMSDKDWWRQLVEEYGIK